MADLRYPIGRPPAAKVEAGNTAIRRANVGAIEALPALLAEAFAGLDARQMDSPYREGGWTLRQVGHHVADSHTQAYARLRFALTEHWPTIKPYPEALWAELEDARTLPVGISLELLVPLHTRWVALLRSLDEAAWQRGYLHPENGPTTLLAMTALYGWHGRHHTAHVWMLRQQMGW